MRVGDKVRLVSIPPNVKDDAEFKTRTILAECLGHTFTVKSFQADGGRIRKRFTPGCWVELEVGEVIPGSLASVWVEPEHLQPASKQKRS